MIKELALEQAFSFALDMAVNTQGRIPAHVAMEEALNYFGWELKEIMHDAIDAHAIPMHACRADRNCPECGLRATE